MEQSFLIINEKRSQLESLAREISIKRVRPEDYYEVAAILESYGWNDARASAVFGVDNVFELAELIWDMMDKDIAFNEFVEEEKDTFLQNAVKVIRSFLRGVIFAMPMTISVLAMLTLRFSLWSYESLDTKRATSIAIGTILSFMTIGGFTQAIARRGFFYINQSFYNMARRVTFYIVKLGYICCVMVGLTFLLINLLFRMLPVDMMTLAVIFFVFLSANWLSVTVMYILKKEIVFTGLITLGIFIVWICFEKLKLFGGNIIYSQVIGLTFITIAGTLLVLYFFKRAEKRAERGISPPFPRLSYMLYSLAPYFSYGFLYFTFLYVDRVIAWSVNGVYMPYILWFRGEYELGLDFALLMLMFPMGVCEVAVNRLMINLEASQKNSMVHDDEILNKKYIGIYFKSIISVLVSGIISAIIVYIIVIYINTYNTEFISSRFALTPTIKFVFIAALASYTLLSVALTNTVILFSLSQPKMVTKVMVWSLIVNCITGFLLSRWIDYYYAVFGLTIGTIVFVIWSSKYVIKVLRNLDYYIYASM
jgi:hypothetical protein